MSTPTSLRLDLLEKLPPGVKIKSRVPFTYVVEPGTVLTREHREILRTIQRDSIEVAKEVDLRWVKVKGAWAKASEWLGQQGAKAASLGKSLVSEVVGPEIPLPVLQKRHISCFGKTLEGDYVGPPCENLVKSEAHGTHHCGGCGCGDSVLTQLEPGLVAGKLLYPYLECPLKKGGFSNEFEDGDFDRKRRVAIFDPNTGGLGDLIAVMWLAGGYKEAGWEVKFLSSGRDWLVRGAGFDVTTDTSQGAYPLNHEFEAYRVELTVDKGKTPRVPLWSSVLPSSPRPLKPVLTLPSVATRVAQVNWQTARDLSGAKGKKVLLAPFAHWTTRMWPLHHYYELAAQLIKDGHVVVAMGLPANEAQLRGFSYGYAQLSLEESFAMIQEADLLVCNDSGPAWMSTLTDTRAVVVVGPSRNIFGNFNHITQVASKDVWCTGCHFQGERGYRLACDYGCESLHSLKPHTVHTLIKEILQCPNLKTFSTPTSLPSGPMSSSPKTVEPLKTSTGT